MKKNLFKKITLLILILFLSFSFSFGSKFKSKRHVLIREEEIVDEDLFVAGETVKVDGKVNGDLFFLAKEITINGEVKGDIIGIANFFTLNGIALDDLRATSQFININGKILKSATLGGQFVNIGKGARIEGDVLLGGSSIKLDGEISGEVRAGGEEIYLTGSIGKSAILDSKEIVVYQNASIKGDLKYRSSKSAEIMEGAKIQGKIEKIPFKKRITKSKWLSWKFYMGKLVFMVAGIIVGSVFLWLFPSYISKVKEQISHIWKSLGIGFILLICVPLAVIILLITIIGIPLALILTAIYLIFLYSGKIIFALFVGEKILKKESPVLSLIVGMIIFTVLFHIPFAGWFFKLIAISIGLGAFGVGSVVFFEETGY